MAEIIGVISGAVGIAAATLHTVRRTSELFRTISDAPSDVKRLLQELHGLELLLIQVNESKYEENRKKGFSTVQLCLETCNTELSRLQLLIGSLGTVQHGDKRFAKRVAYGLKKSLKKEEIKDAIFALLSQKMSLCLALLVDSWSDRQLDPHTTSNHVSRPFQHVRIFEPPEMAMPNNSMPPGVFDYTNMSEFINSSLENAIRKQINESGEKLLEEMRKTPETKLGTILSLNPVQLQALWQLDLKSTRELRDEVHSRRRTDFLNSLPLSDYIGDRLKIKDPQENTCRWIFNHPGYLAWKASNISSTLYICGNAGSGKSVLARHMVESSLTQDSKEDQACLYCFCSSTSNTQKTGSTILGIMIHQLLSAHPSLASSLFEKSGNMDSNSSSAGAQNWPLNSLWEIFLVLIEVSHLKSIYCFIDALDECEVDSISELLQMISEHTANKYRSPGRSEDTTIKLLLTSRPYAYIQDELVSQFTIRLSPAVLADDISKVVDNGMARLQRKFRVPPWAKKQLHENLLMSSEGMFLWVFLAFKQLESTRGATVPKLLKVIERLPKGLDRLYDQMLKRVEEEIDDEEEMELVRRMIVWVTLAEKSLRLSDLSLSLAITTECTSAQAIEPMQNLSWLNGSFFQVENIAGNVSKNPTDISVHGHDVQDGTVRLIHQSAKDYFTGRLSPEFSKFKVDEQVGHAELAMTCLTYLTLPEFEHPVCQDRFDMDRDVDGKTLSEMLHRRLVVYPFLEYAVLCWPYHTRNATRQNQKQTELYSSLLQACGRLLHNRANLEAWYQLVLYFQDTKRSYYPNNFSALHVASLFQLPEILLHTLESQNIDINMRDSTGFTPFLLAIYSSEANSNLHIVELLLDRGADIEAKNAHSLPGSNGLHLATIKGDKDLIKFLLDRGADIEAKNNHGRSALHLASSIGYKEIVELLLDRGADIEAKDSSDQPWKALHLAAWNGHQEVIRLLLDRGALIETEHKNDDRNGLHCAVLRGHKDLVELFLDRGVDIEARNNDCTALHIAARKGHKEMVRLLLDRGADIEATANGWNALHFAASGNHREIIELLLARGADIEARVNDGHTGLHTAAWQSHKDVVELLLDRGANIEATANDGWNALHLAASKNRKEIIELLLDRGADIEAKENNGSNALHIALSNPNSHKEIIELLLDRGADIEARDNDGNTGLHIAACHYHKDVAKLLLDRSADIEAKDNGGRNVLHFAAWHGQYDIVSLFLQRTNNIDVTDYGNWTPLCWASLQACDETAKLLLGHPGYYITGPRDLDRLIQVAILGGSPLILDLLLSKIAGWNQRLSPQCAFLHKAVSYGFSDCVEVLLKHWSNKPELDENGWSLSLCAWRSGRPGLAQRLLNIQPPPANLGEIHTRKPTSWSETDFSGTLQLSEGGGCLELRDHDDNAKSRGAVPARGSVRTDYCAPAEKDVFYYEVEIVNVGTNAEIAIGFSYAHTPLIGLPGWWKGTWAYHGDDGRKFSGEYTGKLYAEPYTTGDVVGCGLRYSTSEIFYTKNSEYLGTAFTGIFGQLYPTVGTFSPGAILRANFGQRPFVVKDIERYLEKV